MNNGMFEVVRVFCEIIWAAAVLGAPEDEFVSQDSNVKGSLSMANTGQPDSGGSQFFINVPRSQTFSVLAVAGGA